MSKPTGGGWQSGHSDSGPSVIQRIKLRAGDSVAGLRRPLTRAGDEGAGRMEEVGERVREAFHSPWIRIGLAAVCLEIAVLIIR